jgi:hypothetical protein
MTMPNPGPDRSVSSDSSLNMAEAMDTMSRNIAALNMTMQRTAEEITASLDIQGRTGFGPDTVLSYQARQRTQTRTPEVTGQALNNMRQHLGVTNDLTLGMTKLDTRQATTSIGHARAYIAQRLGEEIAGGPLYENASGGGGPSPGQPTSGGGGPRRPAGGPPVGQTTSGGGGPGGGPPPPSGGPPSGGGPWGFGGGQWRRPNNRGQTLQALGARIATSGGQSDRLMHAVTHLPGVGLGLEAAQRGGQFYQGQREKGRNYQEIEGGTNLEAQRERGHEEVYRLGMGFGMSEDAARQSFYGVTALGFNRRGDTGTLQNRQNALNFVYHNYNARGMDVGESLGVLQTASSNATVSLRDVSSALKDVSDTAGKAGVNAKTLRASFDELLGAGLQAGAGPGAPRLAGALASTQASYGRSFQGQSFAGQLGPNQTYLIGGRYGISPGQTQQMQRTRPQEYARMLTGNSASVIQMLPGLTPEALNDLRSMIKQYGGAGTIDAQKATAIGNEWLNKWQSRNNIDLNVWTDLINQMTGLQLDNNSVMQWVVQQTGGNTEAAHAQQQGNQQGTAPVKTQGNKYRPDVAPGQNPIRGKQGLAEGKFALDDLTRVNADRTWWGGKGTNQAGEVYANRARDTKQRDPVLEAIIQNVKDPKGTKVEVSTKSGPRVVTFEEAMKSFPNELASGNARFVDGPQAGRSVSEVTGGTVDPGRNTKGEMTSAEGGKIGQSLKDWQKEHPEQGRNTGTQSVTVDLTSEAKRLLQLLPANNNPAAASASPPANPYQQQASRGGG